MTRILNRYAVYGDSEYQNIMQIEMDLNHVIEKDVKEQVFRSALNNVSLFNARLVWKDNCLHLDKNNSVFLFQSK